MGEQVDKFPPCIFDVARFYEDARWGYERVCVASGHDHVDGNETPVDERVEHPVCRLPIRPVTPMYDVVVDRDLDMRGRTFLAERKIVLRTWDEEVLLHECLHALLHEGQMTKVPGYGEDRSTVVHANEEDLVSHFSHGLFQLGFRWVEYEQRETTDD